MAVCAELNERDTGLLLSLEHPSTGLQVTMDKMHLTRVVAVYGSLARVW